MNSILVVVISLALTLALGAFAAYALANWKGKASNLVFFFIVAGMMLPIRIASIRLIQIVKAFGLLNTIWGLIPIYVAMGFPVSVFIMTAFIRSVPGELTESAFIDGAGRLKIFFVIIMPLLKPAILRSSLRESERARTSSSEPWVWQRTNTWVIAGMASKAQCATITAKRSVYPRASATCRARPARTARQLGLGTSSTMRTLPCERSMRRSWMTRKGRESDSSCVMSL